jgi:beta-mannosidase
LSVVASPPGRLVSIDLGGEWTLSLLGGPAPADLPEHIAATVPGCVHDDLIRAALIDDPYRNANEIDAQWVGECDWAYATTVTLSEALLADARIELELDGVDTLAEIAVNGQLTGRSENMHRRQRFDVTSLVHVGANHFQVTLRSAAAEARARREQLGVWPGAYEAPYNYLRKMACSWGWDWGPTLITAGLWRPVRLVAWWGARLGQVLTHAVVDDDGHGRVIVQASVEVVDPQPLCLEATLRAPDGSFVTSADAVVDAGETGLSLELDAGLVRRWWPIGEGDQPLYEVSVSLGGSGEDGDGATDRRVDRVDRRVGFRSVQLLTEPDACGSAFTLVVNRRPMFARGVNWIPDDALVSRVDPARCTARLDDAVELGANLVRVWGGGVYESDAFYEACDERGLMVWQDFLFACSSYPEDLLAAEVTAEAADNVARLAHHPSLVLWNGNNENQWGFADWGWADVLAGRSWGQGFYGDLLPAIVASLDPHRPYAPGSPYSGSADVHPNSPAHGVTHIWDVWNQVDHRRYRDHVPRFAAEFGWQAPPTLPTLRSALDDDPLTPDSPGMVHHQKAIGGDGKLTRGLLPFFDVPSDFDSWLWAMQLNQARAATTGVEHLRSYRGVCMGTIWWQFNDCWPVTSWSLLDSAGRRKPAWHALRAAYEPCLLTVQPRGPAMVAIVVNDGVEQIEGEMRIDRIAFDGQVRASQRAPVRVQPFDTASVVLDAQVHWPGRPGAELIVAHFEGRRASWFFTTDRHLDYELPALTGAVTPMGDRRWEVQISTDRLVRDLSLFPERLHPDATVDRQLVTLLAGESATFTVSGLEDASIETLLDRPVCRSANDLVRSAQVYRAPDGHAART